MVTGEISGYGAAKASAEDNNREPCITFKLVIKSDGVFGEGSFATGATVVGVSRIFGKGKMKALAIVESRYKGQPITGGTSIAMEIQDDFFWGWAFFFIVAEWPGFSGDGFWRKIVGASIEFLIGREINE